MIPLLKVHMPTSVKKPLLDTLFSGYIGQGEKVEEFEKILAKFLGTAYVLTVNSATSALHLALKLANVKPGDEVITTALTCTATNWPILATGADIIWADVDPATANIDPQDISRKITAKTQAIMIVDWGGQPVDIDAIRKIAHKTIKGKKMKIPIIEDAAHAFGAVYKNKKVGNHADFTCFSFQAIKHLTTVDGGALVVKTKKDYDRGKLLRWYGIDRTKKGRDSRIEEDIYEWGYKFHMNDVNATIGIEQMKYIDKILKLHRDNAKYYYKNLEGIKGLTLLYPQKHTLSSNWIFTILVKNRERFQNKLKENGIMTSAVHRRNDVHPVVKKFKVKLPNLNLIDAKRICIPVGWWVTKKDRARIVKVIRHGW